MASIKKYPAFSLIEVLISMIILLIIISLTTFIFVDLSDSGKRHQKLEAIIYSGNILNEAKKDRNYLDEEFDFPGIIIKKTIEDFPESKELKILTITAYKKENKVILERQEMIRTPLIPKKYE